MVLDKLPASWSAITWSQWQELQDLKELKGVELITEQLAVLLDTTPDDKQIQELEIDELFECVNRISWLKSQPNCLLAQTIGEFQFKPLNQLTLGEFIDCEHYIQGGIENFSLIAAILYRRTRLTEWGNLQWEPYEYDLETRAQAFTDLRVSQIWGIFEEYRLWKEDFMQKYDPLLQDSTQEPEDFEKQEVQGEDRITQKREEAQEAAQQQWSWESTIWQLTNGDISKFEAVFNSSVILVFNVMSMRKVLDI